MFGVLAVFMGSMAGTYYANIVIFKADLKTGTSEGMQKMASLP